MNCKPGDLAVVVRSSAGNEGRIAHCLRLATRRQIEQEWLLDFVGEPCWVMDREFASIDNFGRPSPLIRILPDAYLRPIRAPGITTEEVSELFSPSPAKESEKV